MILGRDALHMQGPGVVTLTLDANWSRAAYTILSEVEPDFSGTAVVMEVATGKIRVAVDYSPPSERRNKGHCTLRAIGPWWLPGSTLKIYTTAFGLRATGVSTRRSRLL